MSVFKDSGSWYKVTLTSVPPIKLTSGLRLLTSKTEFPGIPGIVMCPGAADVVTVKGPSAPGTGRTEGPRKV